MVKVRRGTKKDVAGVVALSNELHDQSAAHTKYGSTFDSAHFTKVTTSLLDTGIVQVAVDEDKVVGVLMLVVCPTIYDPSLSSATEVSYYVSPEYRGKGLGLKLVHQVENVAKQLGVRILGLVQHHSVDPKTTAAIYKRAGYSEVETIHVKEI